MAVNIDELERLAKAATPGPWREIERCYSASDYESCGIGSERTCCDVNPQCRRAPYAHGKLTIFKSDAYDECGHPIGRADAEFIAACSPDVVLKLIGMLRAP